jgi:hypothetical protein
MRLFYLTMLILFSLTTKAQTPVAEVYHGCGGATVVSYPPESGWTAVTYTFQKQTGITWTTVLVTINNWHTVIPGELTGPTAFRAIVRNDITSEERISNGVVVDPALFFRTVSAPGVTVIPNWGSTGNPADDYLEVRLSFIGGQNYRPPFKFEWRRSGTMNYQVRFATTSIFIGNIESNIAYDVRVTDFCGNEVLKENEVSPQSLPSATVSNYVCGGGTVNFSLTGSAGLGNRGPFTYALTLLPPGLNPNNLPESFLNSMVFNISGNSTPNVPPGIYVVRAQDRFGVKSRTATVSVGGTAAIDPFQIAFGPGTSYCRIRSQFADPGGPNGPWQIGYRVRGSGEAYTFSTNFNIDALAGVRYEIILRDACGNLSRTSELYYNPLPPEITSIASDEGRCLHAIIVNARFCSSNTWYGLVRRGTRDTLWQTENIFDTLPAIATCYTVIVQDRTNNLRDIREQCSGGLSAQPVITQNNCSDPFSISIFTNEGPPPYRYAIAREGSGFTAFSPNTPITVRETGRYTVRILDACETVADSVIVVGGSFNVSDSGLVYDCVVGDTLGGFFTVNVSSFPNDPAQLNPFHRYFVREASLQGNNIIYGDTVKHGSAVSNTFTIKGLEGNKAYGIFLTDACNRSVTLDPVRPNYFVVPNFGGPQVELALDTSACGTPFIVVSANILVSRIAVFQGRDTTGARIPFDPNFFWTAPLTGGWYTVKLSSTVTNSCPWEVIKRIYVKPFSLPTLSPVSAAVCSFNSSSYSLRALLPADLPPGSWSTSDNVIWDNQNEGRLNPSAQAPGAYTFQYTMTNYCLQTSVVEVTINILPDPCSLVSGELEYESASASTGCKNYNGDAWSYASTTNGELVLGINAGAGNQLTTVCWGIRSVDNSLNPRSITLNGFSVWFASKNFYIEPATVTGGGPVRVRLFFGNADIERLLDFLLASDISATREELRILKKSASTASPVDLNTDVDPGMSGSAYSFITPTLLPFGDDWYAEFEVTDFSEFGLVFTNTSALPLTWGRFTGSMENGAVQLRWTTLAEVNTSAFIIEHSTDGTRFTALGSIPAAGNSSVEKQYAYMHLRPAQGNNYYRIKQTDIDGRFSYSRVLRINNAAQNNSWQLYPNPVMDKATVQIPRGYKGGVALLMDVNGRVVERININPAQSSVTIDMSRLNQGMYILKTDAGTALRIIKN